MIVCAIVGIRSQYMKLAALQRAYRRAVAAGTATFDLRAIDTGQHYTHSLSKQYEAEYDLEIAVNLLCGDSEVSPDSVLARMFETLPPALRAMRCDAVVVFGDASSTLVGSICAKRLGVPLVHVEAGIRTGVPTIEEMNRRVSDCLADVFLASTVGSVDNLLAEGVDPTSIRLTGDLVRDLVENYRTDVLGEYVVASIHRAENTVDDVVLRNLFHVFVDVGLELRFFCHPRLLELARELSAEFPNIIVRESIPHSQMLCEIADSRFVATDSGGLQRESFYLGKRSLVVQEQALWIELVDAGVNIQCAGHDIEKLRAGVRQIESLLAHRVPDLGIFGGPGLVGDRVIAALEALLSREGQLTRGA